MKNNFELLAPGGDVDSIKAAIAAGADAVYCGLGNFNARNKATNITFVELENILKLAHKNNCKVFLALNIIILQYEFPALIRLLNKLVNTKIDGVIVQDLGLFYLLSKYFTSFNVHASTQINTHNEGQVNFIKKINATRVNLSRELNINEIKSLTQIAHKINMKTEVFVHGSYCIGFSGLCYMSSVLSGDSGNRGRCAQPCRDKYKRTLSGKDYPLNLKDNSAFFNLKELADAGVDSLKVEGRMKNSDYVYTVVNSLSKQIAKLFNNDELLNDNTDLFKVFNRDFSNSYLKGEINKNMYIDNSRSNIVKHFIKVNNCSTDECIEKVKQELFEEKIEINVTVNKKIKDLCFIKTPLTISISGEINTTLKTFVKTPDTSFIEYSKSCLVNSKKHSIDYNCIENIFSKLNNSEFYIEKLDIENLQKEVFISFKELTIIRNRILFVLNGSKEPVAPVKVPLINKTNKLMTKPALSLLISSQKDLELCYKTSADIFFQLPDAIKKNSSELIELFLKNKNLIPWFPSILIGDNFVTAVKFLKQVRPKLIVTNNTGIAYKAYEEKINWIAGPFLNITNSFSLLCMKNEFNCYGSFISNEINKNQIMKIVCPDDFKLYYSIYHPILLLSSKQCIFFTTTGCKKKQFNKECLKTCKKAASIANIKENDSFIIDKQKGSHNCMYSSINFLNTEIITDLHNIFSSYLIDLRDIKTETNIDVDKLKVIQLFENLLNGMEDSTAELKQVIYPSTNVQYEKGLKN